IEQNSELLGATGHTAVGLQGFASASIGLPIFNRNQGNVAAAAADITTARAEVKRVQLSLEQKIQPLLESYLAARTSAERYRTAMIPRAERAYRMYLDKYRQMGAAY